MEKMKISDLRLLARKRGLQEIYLRRKYELIEDIKKNRR